MITNRFAEVRETNNQLSPKAALEVAGIVKKLNADGIFNLAALGLMEVAHDLHTHGAPIESKFAEEIIAGVAKGLRSTPPAKKMKLCPNCGRRHA